MGYNCEQFEAYPTECMLHIDANCSPIIVPLELMGLIILKGLYQLFGLSLKLVSEHYIAI